MAGDAVRVTDACDPVRDEVDADKIWRRAEGTVPALRIVKALHFMRYAATLIGIAVEPLLEAAAFEVVVRPRRAVFSFGEVHGPHTDAEVIYGYRPAGSACYTSRDRRTIHMAATVVPHGGRPRASAVMTPEAVHARL